MFLLSSMEIWNISLVQLQFELSCCLNIRMKYDDEILSFRRKCVMIWMKMKKEKKNCSKRTVSRHKRTYHPYTVHSTHMGINRHLALRLAGSRENNNNRLFACWWGFCLYEFIWNSCGCPMSVNTGRPNDKTPTTGQQDSHICI